jgi:hyperosmotically inducible protein
MRLQPVLLLVSLAVAGSRAAAPSRGHERLGREMRHELVMLPFYGVFDDFAVEGGHGHNVRLLGQVTRPTLKTDAERAVKRIEGIESTSDRIEVLPLSPNDDRIGPDAYRAIYPRSALNHHALMAVPSIHIIVTKGNVTLEEVVGLEADKNIARIQANSVPSVFSVADNLRVDGEK